MTPTSFLGWLTNVGCWRRQRAADCRFSACVWEPSSWRLPSGLRSPPETAQRSEWALSPSLLPVAGTGCWARSTEDWPTPPFPACTGTMTPSPYLRGRSTWRRQECFPIRHSGWVPGLMDFSFTWRSTPRSPSSGAPIFRPGPSSGHPACPRWKPPGAAFCGVSSTWRRRGDGRTRRASETPAPGGGPRGGVLRLAGVGRGPGVGGSDRGFKGGGGDLCHLHLDVVRCQCALPSSYLGAGGPTPDAPGRPFDHLRRHRRFLYGGCRNRPGRLGPHHRLVHRLGWCRGWHHHSPNLARRSQVGDRGPLCGGGMVGLGGITSVVPCSGRDRVRPPLSRWLCLHRRGSRLRPQAPRLDSGSLRLPRGVLHLHHRGHHRALRGDRLVRVTPGDLNRHLAKHVGEDPAMAVVLGLHRGVDPQPGGKLHQIG